MIPTVSSLRQAIGSGLYIANLSLQLGRFTVRRQREVKPSQSPAASAGVGFNEDVTFFLPRHRAATVQQVVVCFSGVLQSDQRAHRIISLVSDH